MTEEFKCKLQCQGEILTRRSPSTKQPMMKNWPESTSHCHVGVHSLSQESFISSPTHFFVVQNDFNEIIFKNHFPPDFPFICHWLITQRLPTLCLSFLALSVYLLQRTPLIIVRAYEPLKRFATMRRKEPNKNQQHRYHHQRVPFMSKHHNRVTRLCVLPPQTAMNEWMMLIRTTEGWVDSSCFLLSTPPVLSDLLGIGCLIALCSPYLHFSPLLSIPFCTYPELLLSDRGGGRGDSMNSPGGVCVYEAKECIEWWFG